MLEDTGDMKTFNSFLADVSDRYQVMFGQKGARYDRIFSIIAPPVLSKLADGDAPYHTVDHTLQVIRVGQDLLEGKQYYEGSVSPLDWLNTTISLLCHDVGYVKGVCQGDRPRYQQYDDGQGGQVCLPVGATGAALSECHVDRSQYYVATHLSKNFYLDIDIIRWNIEMTRFPISEDSRYEDTVGYGSLCRAADLIGQLSDPQYLQKLPALFAEFEETGMNQAQGYKTPEDIKVNYPAFYQNVVYPHIQHCIKYLNVTPTGRKCLAQLYTNVRLANVHTPRDVTRDITTSPFGGNFKELDGDADWVPWQESGFAFTYATIDGKFT